MQKIKIRLILYLCIAGMLIPALAYSKNKPELSALEPAETVKFTDIPAPAGFRLLPAESYSFESAGVRVGFLKYQGKAAIEQLVSFYKEQMAMYNWNLLNIIEYGERMLNFDRENETCIINLLPKGKTVNITVSLGPKSQNLPKKAKEPVK